MQSGRGSVGGSVGGSQGPPWRYLWPSEGGTFVGLMRDFRLLFYRFSERVLGEFTIGYFTCKQEGSELVVGHCVGAFRTEPVGNIPDFVMPIYLDLYIDISYPSLYLESAIYPSFNRPRKFFFTPVVLIEKGQCARDSTSHMLGHPLLIEEHHFPIPLFESLVQNLEVEYAVFQMLANRLTN